ncbi:zinc ABC transporter permease AztB [Actinomyces mediterranea]|uniref:zinc ABC transporter permease AztB n=1 Tax=Actinomyces mediterranea TaxID=1871028 RepID=UPI000970897E|nr:zinc ABC transporter permease AztB [Actinomyces mediterranea]
MSFLLVPLNAGFFTNALIGGTLAAWICALAGTWVIIRKMAFLGEAISHGMLPGVAVAALAGWHPLVGAGASALVMATGIGWLTRRARLSQDTAIGIAFVTMLSVGVIIVSRSRSFATDLTAILFGDILAISRNELTVLVAALGLTLALTLALRRPLLALALDESVAHTLHMRPRLASFTMTILVTLAVVASYRAVGSLLVVALLIAPPATARLWSHSVASTMILAGLIATIAVIGGLYISWYAGTAAGASISALSGVLFLTGVLITPLIRRTSAAPLPTGGHQ